MSYIGNPIVSTDFPVDYFSGNGSITAFTMSVAPASVNAIDVQVSGVSQSPQTYSVSGTTLTFTAAPPSGTNNIVVRHLGVAGIPNTPSAASVTPAALSTPNAVYWDVNGNVGVGTTSPSGVLDVRKNQNATTNFYLQNTDTTNTNSRAYLNLVSGTNYLTFKSIQSDHNYIDRPTGTNLYFQSNSSSQMVLDTSGNLLVGKTTTSPNTVGTVITSGGNVIGSKASEPFSAYVGAGGAAMAFWRIDTSVYQGGIYLSPTLGTSYTTASDYRLKENIAPMTGALDKVSALKPVTYKWKTNGSDGQGFIAHELAEVCPEAVVGEKDAVDSEGKPVYQGIDTSFLVATLTAAIQELKAELDATKAEVAALKAAA